MNSNEPKSLSSFQPSRKEIDLNQVETNGQSHELVPPIPEPDYSSDEDGAAKDKPKRPIENGVNKQSELSSTASPSKPKLTTTATVVLKSSSPLPPPEDTKKNMFEELREQSAKIAGSARLRFASTNGSDGVRKQNFEEEQNSQSNVMRNVAEFEKRLGKEFPPPSTNRATNGITIDSNSAQMRMSKSCFEEFVPNQLNRGSRFPCSNLISFFYIESH